VAARHIGGDRQTQPHAPAPVRVARLVKPCEGSHRFLPPLAGDARTVVLDADPDAALGHGHADLTPCPIAQRIADQVFDGPRHRIGTQQGRAPAVAFQADRPGRTPGIVDNPGHQRDRIGFLGGFHGVAAGK